MVSTTTKVKAHLRTSKKTGKTTTVKEHTKRYDASAIAKEALRNKKRAGKEFEKVKNKNASFLDEISALPKTFRHMGEQYVPTGKIKTHTEKLGGATYKVATCKAKSKNGNTITLYQYNKKGRKELGLPKKWDVDVTM